MHRRGKNRVARVTLRDAHCPGVPVADATNHGRMPRLHPATYRMRMSPSKKATWETTEFRLRIAMFPLPFPLMLSEKTPLPVKEAFIFHALCFRGLQNMAKRNAKNIFYR